MKTTSHYRFTLVEMLAVIMILAVLFAMLMPSLQRARDRAQGVVCTGNMRQLAVAHTTYTRDFDFDLPGSDTGKRDADWVAGGDSPTAIEDGTLYEYTQELGVYRCPKDFRWVKFKDSDPAHLDYFWRAYSINLYLNGIKDKEPGIVRKWTKVKKSFDQVFVFVEEQDPRGYNINSFYVSRPTASLSTWSNADWMAPLHLQGYNLTFLDGHVEYIKIMDLYSLAASKAQGMDVPDSNVDRQKLWSYHLPE
ncbi:MAG: prepilin-type processing-associated H-X9-DG protein [Rhodothermales bacterium]|jgi:prepilin-type processing-associated H-X9-DG protein